MPGTLDTITKYLQYRFVTTAHSLEKKEVDLLSVSLGGNQKKFQKTERKKRVGMNGCSYGCVECVKSIVSTYPVCKFGF